MRGVVVGVLVFGISCFFTRPVIHDIWVVILFMLLTAAVSSLAALINGIFARNFDEVAFFQNFILTPFIYLGGVFYSIHSLPPFWQKAVLDQSLGLHDQWVFGAGFSRVLATCRLWICGGDTDGVDGGIGDA